MNSENFKGFSNVYTKDEVVIPPEKAGKKIVINILLTLVVAAVGYYFMLPAFNFKDVKMYFYFGLIAIAYPIFSFITSKALMRPEYLPYVKKSSLIPGSIICLLILVVVAGSLVSSVFFRAKDFSQLLTVEEGVFTEKFEDLDFDSVPMLDEDSAKRLGGRQLGKLSEYVSQYEDAEDYTQINYKGRPVRVTTLKYANIIKWFTNREQGIPAYMIVDMSTQEVEVVKLKELGMENIKYSPAEHFSRLLTRHLRFQYKTFLFDDPTFEIDEKGRPYWICPRIDKKIGLFGGDDVIGIVLVDATTGDSKYYDIETVKNNPKLQWVDRVYSSSLITQQYDYYGQYRDGFFNSVLGQKDVKVTTSGSNYIAIDDDVYMYTGVTSVTSDDSIIGFILTNQRTKETTFFEQSGATESSAQGSAEGKVQQYSYQATFPLLLNIKGEPTFFMALKDAEGLVKMYSLVNVEQFQKVVVEPKLVDCLQAYYNEMGIDGDAAADLNEHVSDIDIDGSGTTQSNKKTVEGVITDIRSAVLNGNTYYYIKVDGYDPYFSISASQSTLAIILNKGDKVKITVSSTDGRIVEAIAIEQ